MPKRTRDYRSWLKEQLTDPIKAAHYINAAVSDSPEMLLIALRNVAEAKKMSKVADEAQVNRETLYRTLSGQGNPTLDTLNSVLDAVGLNLRVEPKQVTMATSTLGSGTTQTITVHSGANQVQVDNTASQTCTTSYFSVYITDAPVSPKYQDSGTKVPAPWMIVGIESNDNSTDSLIGAK